MSKLIPRIQKLIGTHHIMRFVCQGPPSLYKGGLRTPGGPKNCDFIKYDKIYAWCISKSIPRIQKFIGTHHIMIFVCQGPPSLHKGGLRAPGGPKKLRFYQIWWNIGMVYIKIDPKDTETHHIMRFVCQGLPSLHKGGLRPGAPQKLQFYDGI